VKKLPRGILALEHKVEQRGEEGTRGWLIWANLGKGININNSRKHAKQRKPCGHLLFKNPLSLSFP